MIEDAMKQNKQFAVWFAEARRKANITQAKLAEYLDVSQATIHYWEDVGRMWMEPAEIRDLARLLRVEPVEVADALGYPTRPRQNYASPLPPHVLEERIADLSLRLGRTVEDWAIETFPVEGEGDVRNGRNGSRS